MKRLRVKRIRRKHRWQFGISSNPWMDSFSIHWLHNTPIKRWRPIYQKILFTSVLTSGQGQGWRHWHLAGSRCNNLVPKQEAT